MQPTEFFLWYTLLPTFFTTVVVSTFCMIGIEAATIKRFRQTAVEYGKAEWYINTQGKIDFRWK